MVQLNTVAAQEHVGSAEQLEGACDEMGGGGADSPRPEKEYI